jgi:hypothetical protein
MNAQLAAQLPSSLPLVAPVLQGAAVGSVIAAAVLVRAWRGRLRIEPWAVTSAWSLLGALTTLLVIAILMLASGSQRSIPRDPVVRSRSASRSSSSSSSSCERTWVASWRSAGSRISSGRARR